jgi:hypothetical protein
LVLINGFFAVLEIYPHFFSDFQLHGVVTWGNSLDVPLKLVKLTVALKVKEDSQINEDKKYTEAGDDRGHVLLLCEDFLGLLTSVGHKDPRILALALFRY